MLVQIDGSFHRWLGDDGPQFTLRLVNPPGYSPDFNADEAIWGWVREEATGNLCSGTRAAVQERSETSWTG